MKSFRNPNYLERYEDIVFDLEQPLETNQIMLIKQEPVLNLLLIKQEKLLRLIQGVRS